MLHLQKQHDFFECNKTTLVETYKNKFIVISESLEVTPFDDKMAALQFGVATYGTGQFMIKECNPDTINTVFYISSYCPV